MVFYTFIQISVEHSVSKQWRSNQMLCYAASDLGLPCLHISHKKDTMLIWVNPFILIDFPRHVIIADFVFK